jgi:hypothetical protein
MTNADVVRRWPVRWRRDSGHPRLSRPAHLRRRRGGRSGLGGRNSQRRQRANELGGESLLPTRRRADRGVVARRRAEPQPILNAMAACSVRRRRLRLEVEQVEQIADRGAVGRGVIADRGVVCRVWQIIAAAARDSRQLPVALDELQDRDVVGVGVADMAAAAEVGDDDGTNGEKANAGGLQSRRSGMAER